jgi:hypothetical protein
MAPPACDDCTSPLTQPNAAREVPVERAERFNSARGAGSSALAWPYAHIVPGGMRRGCSNAACVAQAGARLARLFARPASTRSIRGRGRRHCRGRCRSCRSRRRWRSCRCGRRRRRCGSSRLLCLRRRRRRLCLALRDRNRSNDQQRERRCARQDEVHPHRSFLPSKRPCTAVPPSPLRIHTKRCRFPSKRP